MLGRVVMNDQTKHAEFLKNKFHVLEEVSKEMDSAQLAALERYGAWLQALERGDILPRTKEQERFLLVCNGVEPPGNVIEMAWYNYKKIVSKSDSKKFGQRILPGSRKGFRDAAKCAACGRTLNFCICNLR